MIEINTSKQKNLKKVMIDGFTYMVRRPGAGESLDLSQFGKEATALEKRKDTLTEEEKETLTASSMNAIRIVLGFFDGIGDQKASEHIRSIDPEELMGVVKEIFEDSTES